MAERDKDPPAEKLQRFRFRVVAPDGRELVSDVAHVRFPAKMSSEPGFRVTEILVGAKAKKQGVLKGEDTGEKGKDRFGALALEYELRSPRDAATGQPSGKRQHSALSVVKEWGAASPQLFQALVTNELLETVDIDCYGVLESGEKGLVHKVKLTNASVSAIAQRGGGEAGPHELETVDFTFEKIEHLSAAGGGLAGDAARDPAPG